MENVEIKAGQIWKFIKVNRPDVEISDYNQYNKTVYWHYIDSPQQIYEMNVDSFLRDLK